MTSVAPALPKSAGGVASRAIPAWLAPVVTGALVFLVGTLIIEAYVVGVAHDDGMYVMLGKALATGRGYRWLNLPGAPPATHFPPGYPAVLALLWWIFPQFPGNIAAFELANALFMSLAAVGVFFFVRSRFGMSDRAAALLALATTLGIPTLTLTVLVMSEPLFLALLIPILFYAEQIVDGTRRHPRDVVILALCVGAATLVRTHGIALVGAVTIALLLRKRLRDTALFAGVAVATLVPWQLWVAAHAHVVPATMQGNYESYGAWFAAGVRADGFDLVGRTFLRTTGNLSAMFGVLVAPAMGAGVRAIALILLLSSGIAGARALWRRAPATALFLVLYSAIVLVWPFWPQRFFWGVWPLVFLLPVLGVRQAYEWHPARPLDHATRIAMLASGAALAFGYLAYNMKGYRHQWWASIPRSVSNEVRPTLTWIATHIPPHAVIAAEAETSVFLYTGRPAVPVGTFTVDEFFAPRTPAQNAAVIDTVIARYRPMAVVVSSGAMRDAVHELAFRTPPRLAVVDTFANGGLVLIPQSR